MKMISNVRNSPTAISKRLRFRAAEATKLIEQQMYLLGRDILSPKGNLLRAYGCTAEKLPGQKHHIRVYQHRGPGAIVTLHSTGIALVLTGPSGEPLPGVPGVLYLRPHHALFRFDPTLPPPLPCLNQQQPLELSVRKILFTAMPQALRVLLRWIRDYETWCVTQVGPHERREGYRDYRKVPHAVRWVAPDESLQWLHSLPLAG